MTIGRQRADDLRRRLADGESVVLPGVWDAWSAMIAAEAGFSSVFVSGFAVSATALGLPDVGHVGQADMVDVARKVTMAAPTLNAVVDADTGYGNAMSVRRTVALWEEAGAAGIFLEDQTWPKRCGHMSGKEVIPRGEWLTKLRAALDARDHLHVTARTDALGVVSVDEAIERGRMARDLGVDAVFVEAPRSVDDLERIGRGLSGVTLVANMVEHGRTPLLTATELRDLGFRMVVSPLSLLLSATHAARVAAAELAADGTLRGSLARVTPFDEFNRFIGLPQHIADSDSYR